MINTELLLIAFVSHLMKTMVLSVFFLHFNSPPPHCFKHAILTTYIGDCCSNLGDFDFPFIPGPCLDV